MRLNRILLLFLYYNLIFSLHEFIFYSIYTTLPLSVYSRVLGYFWLSRPKPKNQKTIKNIKTKKPKNQISNLKKPLFFSTPDWYEYNINASNIAQYRAVSQRGRSFISIASTSQNECCIPVVSVPSPTFWITSVFGGWDLRAPTHLCSDCAFCESLLSRLPLVSVNIIIWTHNYYTPM